MGAQPHQQLPGGAGVDEGQGQAMEVVVAPQAAAVATQHVRMDVSTSPVGGT